MREFKLSKIWILSNIEKSGNVFTFEPQINLIMSKDENSVGKSSLVKTLLWTFGCEPYFDSAWSTLDISSKIEFSIDNNEYIIFRNRNNYLIENNGESYFFNDFKKYVDFFCNIVNFFPMLENRKTKILELPSPAYYFIPFYIDQKKGWSHILSSFKNLGQYAYWQRTILKYHCGITSNEVSRIDYEISKYRFEKKEHEGEREKFENAIEVVSEINIDNDFNKEYRKSLNNNIDLIDNQFEDLIKSQNDILSKISVEKNLLLDLKAQKSYSLKLAKELESDFIFATENFTSDTIECPLCGTNHRNTIIEKSKLVKDQDDLTQFISGLDNDIISVNKNYNSLKEDLFRISHELELFHKEILLDSENLLNHASTERSMNLVESKANEMIESKNRLINSLDTDIRKKEDEKKLVNHKFSKNEIKLEFQSLFKEFNDFLATDYSDDFIASSDVFDYPKFDTNGGAADSTRSIFLYHSVLIKMIQKFSNENIAPFIIDTPNQQEQAKSNYEKIISALFEKFPKNIQIIVCAMENDALDKFKSKSHVITLSKRKSLLQKEKYLEISSHFHKFKSEIDSNTIVTF
ncbi:hypothetical protein [Acinetobacter soli]|uniref:hypothetical protein n=1 Tax=Acinetobacter soli TaxID=487316 RepID=UPI003AA7E03B